MKITIKTAHGFLSAQPVAPGASVVWQYRPTVGEWEQFEVDGLVFPSPAPIPVPPAPAPGPAPKPTPVAQTAENAKGIVNATAQQYFRLTQVFGDDKSASDAAVELLLRIIWRLQQAGFDAARQKNPSGLISGDKLCIFLADGQWHVYDIFSLGFANRATTVQFLEITGAQPVADSGIADSVPSNF